MTTRFKSQYSDDDAFYLRADLLRPMFGLWDCEDPVSHAILDVVEAQRELSDAIADDVCGPRSVGGNAAIKAAVEKRRAASERLIEDRGSG
jgi:hypothetical protein